MEKIGASFRTHMAMARGVMILNENTLFLQEPLEKKNFCVYRVQAGMKDQQIAPLLARRIFVTNNAKSLILWWS
jgi:hypothetical protein